MSLLLAYKADVQGYGGHFGDTLQAAAFGGHEKAVDVLIHYGANNFWEQSRGRHHSALGAALYAGHQSIVQMLLEAGAKPNPPKLQFADCLVRKVSRREITSKATKQAKSKRNERTNENANCSKRVS